MRERIRFILVDAFFLHKGSDLFRFDQPARAQFGERCQNNKFGVHLEEMTQLLAAIATTETVGA